MAGARGIETGGSCAPSTSHAALCGRCRGAGTHAPSGRRRARGLLRAPTEINGARFVRPFVARARRGAGVGCLAASASDEREIRVIFTTHYVLESPLHGIRVTGATPALGSWEPHGLVLHRVEEGQDVWTGEARLPRGAAHEFKFIVVECISDQPDGIQIIRWQEGPNRVLDLGNLAASSPSSAVSLYVPWHGDLTQDVASAAPPLDGARSDAEDTDTVAAIRKVIALLAPKDAKAFLEQTVDVIPPDGEVVIAAMSRSVSASVDELGALIAEAERSAFDAPDSDDALSQDARIAAASRKCSIAFEMVNSAAEQLLSGDTHADGSQAESLPNAASDEA